MRPPGYRRRRHAVAVTAAVAAALLCACSRAVLCCERVHRPPAPAATAADARYALHIAGEPTVYVPGELYTVSVKAAEEGPDRASFTGFSIWTEVEESDVGGRDNATGADGGGGGDGGALQAYDTQSTPHGACAGALTNSTRHAKTEIQVMWTAPAPTEKAGCVVLVTRLGDDLQPQAEWTTLERRLCPEELKLYGAQPPITNPCCACDEAKYEVTFEGMWSRNTHPKDFPADERITRFSDVIGASHTVHYRLWEVGRAASQGLRELAEEGHTTTLEKELKAENDNIRTIIKARGMSWPRLGGATFAVFRVDARRHLVSLVSRLSPSPDWVVGVSALELCSHNCTWLESDVIDLFPYDAGTDSGITYMSRRHRTTPPGPVRALRPDWPRDGRSPFYDVSGAAMKPFARMRLTRQRLYEKNCDAQAASPAEPADGGGVLMSAEREEWGACATGAWGAWGTCSVTCGVGVSARQRYYLESARAALHACRRPLTEHRRCRGPRMHCRAASEYEQEWSGAAAGAARGACALSEWSAWSACSARECEPGVRVRTRHYLHRAAHKRCHTGWLTRPKMDQTLTCVNEQANCSFEEPTSTLTYNLKTAVALDPVFDETNSTNSTLDSQRGGAAAWEEVACPVSPWGEWSTCSARCGRGRRMRTRLYLAPAVSPHNVTASRRASRLQTRLTAHLTALWNQRFAAWQNIEVPAYNATEPDPELEERLARQLQLCDSTLTMQEGECEGRHANCRTVRNATACALPLAVGACRSYSERWFYDLRTRVCEPFGYTGCLGNDNNFHSRDHCLQHCANFTGEPIKNANAFGNTKPKPPENELQNDDEVQNDDNNASPWTRVSQTLNEVTSLPPRALPPPPSAPPHTQ